MFISNKTVFLEKEFLREGTNVSKIKLDEIHEIQELIHTESDLIEELNLKPIETPLRRSDRIPHQLDRYYNFLIQDGDPIKLDENDEDPITYMEAVQRPNSQKWLETMKFEMKFMKINGVWILVDPSERIKPIGCK